jgi:hypothetical protein
LLQGESVEENGMMVHNENNGASARGNSDVNAVHGGNGKQLDNKPSELVSFDGVSPSCLIKDLVHRARTEQVIQVILYWGRLITVGLCLDLDI